MRFPLWQYLNQPLWDNYRPSILNPAEYWRHYQRLHLDRCFHNAFLEHCWSTNYQDFVRHYHAFFDRVPLEEDSHWLVERCWYSKVNLWAYEHPENQVVEAEN